MFDVGWSEMLVIGAVALIVIGPKDLPGALRTLGQSLGKIRRMAGEFKQQFDEAMREAEVDKIKEDLLKAEADAKAAAQFDFNPVEDVKKEIQSAMEAVDKKPEEPAKAEDRSMPVEVAAADAPAPPVDIEPPEAPDATPAVPTPTAETPTPTAPEPRTREKVSA